MERKLTNGTVIHFDKVDFSPAVLNDWAAIKVNKVVDPDGSTHEDNECWWVVNNYKELPICICARELDAKIVASALDICESMRKRAMGSADVLKAMNDELKAKLKDKWDTDRIEADIRKMMDEGKTKEEVFDYMAKHKSDYAKPTATTDDFKIPEGW